MSQHDSYSVFTQLQCSCGWQTGHYSGDTEAALRLIRKHQEAEKRQFVVFCHKEIPNVMDGELEPPFFVHNADGEYLLSEKEAKDLMAQQNRIFGKDGMVYRMLKLVPDGG